MIVVADTTPINYLILIECIELLPAMYGQIFIPHAVRDELLHGDAPPAVRAWANDPPAWLQFLSPSTQAIAAIPELDPGETEAIALALELRADWLLIDETAGRTEATRRGLQTVGTLGILRDAHRAGLLNLKTALQSLQVAGFYVSQSVIQEVLNSV